MKPTENDCKGSQKQKNIDEHDQRLQTAVMQIFLLSEMVYSLENFSPIRSAIDK